MKARIYLTRVLPEHLIERLSETCDVTVNRGDLKLSEDKLIEAIRDMDGVICLLNDSITERVLRSNPNLKVVANFGVGYNNIDVKVASELGIMVTNTPGVLDETTAELALSLMMAVSRRIVEGDTYVRRGEWTTGWELNLFQGFDLHHKTLGIIGFGNIGQALAKMLSGFSMPILYHNRNRLSEATETLYNATYSSKDDLLSRSDIVSLHCPLTPETRHLITHRELQLMKSTAILINTARGEVVNEKDLYEALKAKTIWAAGLDVFEREPLLHPGLADLNNVTLLPHIGSASVETRSRMGTMVVDNLIAGISGNTPANLVNAADLIRR
ncbi:MAG: D-glycerate dehydrogenase [Spirochaetota bacterium]|nr:D-glycerate dehydrogenase [Spirochaetota bacterium]